jgi:hypothetical protein
LGDREDHVVRAEQDKESSNEAHMQAPYPPAGYFVVELSDGGPQGVIGLENVEGADVEGLHTTRKYPTAGALKYAITGALEPASHYRPVIITYCPRTVWFATSVRDTTGAEIRFASDIGF